MTITLFLAQHPLLANHNQASLQANATNNTNAANAAFNRDRFILAFKEGRVDDIFRKIIKYHHDITEQDFIDALAFIPDKKKQDAVFNFIKNFDDKLDKYNASTSFFLERKSLSRKNLGLVGEIIGNLNSETPNKNILTPERIISNYPHNSLLVDFACRLDNDVLSKVELNTLKIIIGEDMSRTSPIIRQEPEQVDYIFIDDSNKVHLLAPVVSGSRIGLDNTCKATLEFQDFLFNGKAKNALEKYQKALIYDINQLEKPEYSAEKNKKIERLTQVQSYLTLIQKISTDIDTTHSYRYPDALKSIMNKQTNSLNMLLSPTKIDSVLHLEKPIFSLARYDGNTMLHPPGLGSSLRQQFHDVDISRINSSQISTTNNSDTPISKVIAELKTIYGEDTLKKNFQESHIELSELKQNLVKIIKKEFQLDFNLSSSTDGSTLDRDYMENILMIVDFTEDGVEQIAECLLRSGISDHAWPQPETKNSLFQKIKDKEALQMAVQFFLGEANIFCYKNKLSTQNFGPFFDSEPHCSAIASGVINQLEQGKSVEDFLLTYILNHKRELGLTRDLGAQELLIIKNDFQNDFQTIHGSDHYDEFMLFAENTKGDFVTHQNRISTSFYDFAVNFFSNQEVQEEDVRDALETLKDGHQAYHSHYEGKALPPINPQIASIQQRAYKAFLEKIDKLTCLELMSNSSIITPSFAIKKFPDDVDIIKKAFRLDPQSIKNIDKEKIYGLISPDGPITPQEALKILPNDMRIITAACKADITLLDKQLADDIALLFPLYMEGVISGEEAIKAFPKNQNIVLSVINGNWGKNEHLITFADPKLIVALLDAGKIKPATAFKYFPDNVDVTLKCKELDREAFFAFMAENPEFFQQPHANYFSENKISNSINISDIQRIVTIKNALKLFKPEEIVDHVIYRGVVTPLLALEAFPENEDIVQKLVNTKPATIIASLVGNELEELSKKQLAQTIEKLISTEGPITPEVALRTFDNTGTFPGRDDIIAKARLLMGNRELEEKAKRESEGNHTSQEKFDVMLDKIVSHIQRKAPDLNNPTLLNDLKPTFSKAYSSYLKDTDKDKFIKTCHVFLDKAIAKESKHKGILGEIKNFINNLASISPFLKKDNALPLISTPAQKEFQSMKNTLHCAREADIQAHLEKDYGFCCETTDSNKGFKQH